MPETTQVSITVSSYCYYGAAVLVHRPQHPVPGEAEGALWEGHTRHVLSSWPSRLTARTEGAYPDTARAEDQEVSLVSSSPGPPISPSSFWQGAWERAGLPPHSSAAETQNLRLRGQKDPSMYQNLQVGLELGKVSKEKVEWQAKNSVRTARDCTMRTQEKTQQEWAVRPGRVVFHAGSSVILTCVEGNSIQRGLTGSFVVDWSILKISKSHGMKNSFWALYFTCNLNVLLYMETLKPKVKPLGTKEGVLHSRTLQVCGSHSGDWTITMDPIYWAPC